MDISKIADEKIKFETDSQIQTSIEPKLEETTPSESSQSSLILPIQLKADDTPNLLLFKDILPSDKISINQSLELPCSDGNRERTLSDASSSATIDYDFDTEICTSKSVDIDI